MGCEELTFFSPENLKDANAVFFKNGSDWHLYGDTRWPSLSSWIEIDTSCGGFFGYSGVLIVTYEIPNNEPDLFVWIANNGPLNYLFPEQRSTASINGRLDALRQAATTSYNGPGPTDSNPRFVQSYCIYRGPGNIRLVASYTDILNADGIPISRFRIADVEPFDVEVCRFTLHALFCLNRARLNGMKFVATPQLDTHEPLYLTPDETIPPPWVLYHPLRTLRTRPAVRAILSPNNLTNGMMHLETAQSVLDVRRREANLHMLAFATDARPRLNINEDGNACMAAFSHRVNGGAIYLLPNRLVEEFDNTDCEEILTKDIKLPFSSVFLKFASPQPLFLNDGARVDGCYIVKQGDEYLISLTARWDGVDYSQSLSVVCLDPTFSIHLPAPELKLDQPGKVEDVSINEAVELGIKEFLETNAPPSENVSRHITRPDGTTVYVEDIRAQSRKRRIDTFRSQEPIFRACLNIIINAACFISFRPEDITEEWDGNLPTWVDEALKDTRNTRSARDRKQHALRIIANDDYTRIRVCGKNLFSDREETVVGHGQSPRAHWRRGHWRRQRHGAALSLMTPRWIRPTIVKKDNGPLVEIRYYDVQEPPSKSGA